MAVTVVDKVVTMTAQDDEFPVPCVIKSISWIGATTVGHLLELSQSATLGDNTKAIYTDVAAGANYVSRTLIEQSFPHGFELTDLDSGTVQVILK